MSTITASTLNIVDSERRALDELIAHVRVLWPQAKFTLFGSKARGGGDEESDLDILILLPCPVSDEIRRQIVHRVFDVNLIYGSNISVLIVSDEEWGNATFSLLPIHEFIEEEGIPL